MNSKNSLCRLAVASACILLAAASAPAKAQSRHADTHSSAIGAASDTASRSEAEQQVNRAVQVLRRMRADPALATMLVRSSGVFIVPDYARAAFVVGGRGGAGVLLVRHGDTWTDPAFYHLGGISAGVQAGAEGGAVAFMLNNQKALDSFMQDNKFSLGADAGLTIVDWQTQGQREAGRGDIAVWSDTRGLFGGLAIGVTDVRFDAERTAAYYGRPVAARDVIIGSAGDPQARSLQRALAGMGAVGASTSVGSSGTAGTTQGEPERR